MNKRKGPIPEEFTDATRGIRLQKAMADAGVASRRECEVMIEAGRVVVNDKLITALPAWVDPETDHIVVDGQPVRRNRGGRPIYIMLNKPRGVITTNNDPQGRTSVLDLVKMPGNPRIFPVGRLDAESTGLIILTNDGELSHQLTHPSHEVPKEYHVAVKGRLTERDLELLRKGLFLVDRKKQGAKRAAVESVKLIAYARGKSGSHRTRIAVTLTEGQNREIRRLLARLGFPVRRLERVAIGKLRLKGLATGEWKILSPREIAMLRNAARDTRGEGRGV